MTAIGTSSSSATTRSTAASWSTSCSLPRFLGYLKIAAPETALVQVSADFLAANPEVHITLGTRRIEVEPGWHFGSRYPGDPAPHRGLRFPARRAAAQVVNLEDFRAILVFDKWVGNADGRQSVFYRALVRQDMARRRPAPGGPVSWPA